MSGLLIFELLTIIFVVGLFIYMKQKGYTNILRKFLILFVSILLFEIMSEPMWNNSGFQSWTYIWQDITWVITLGWIGIFMFTFLFVDYAFPTTSEKKKFWIYLLFLEAIVVPIESILLISGVREYAPILANTLSGYMIPLTQVPLEAVFAIPLFTTLIICFYKYANYLFDTK
jgi:hypothetical protein